MANTGRPGSGAAGGTYKGGAPVRNGPKGSGSTSNQPGRGGK